MWITKKKATIFTWNVSVYSTSYAKGTINVFKCHFGIYEQQRHRKKKAHTHAWLNEQINKIQLPDVVDDLQNGQSYTKGARAQSSRAHIFFFLTLNHWLRQLMCVWVFFFIVECITWPVARQEYSEQSSNRHRRRCSIVTFSRQPFINLDILQWILFPFFIAFSCFDSNALNHFDFVILCIQLLNSSLFWFESILCETKIVCIRKVSYKSGHLPNFTSST